MTEDEPLRCRPCDHNMPRDRREGGGLMLWPLFEFSCTLASLTSVALGKMDHAILSAVLAVSAKLELMRGNR